MYPAGGFDTEAIDRITSDELPVGADGRVRVVLGGGSDRAGPRLRLPEGPAMVWVREFLDQPADRPDTGGGGGWSITRLDPVPTPPPVDPRRFGRRLSGTATVIEAAAGIIAGAAAAEDGRHNQVREWEEMRAGAAFTEPGIHYQRGCWALEDGQALVVEGELVASRHWSVVLYSRFLNSLDHRNRRVSLTGGRLGTVGGRYRLVLAAEAPDTGDWLDTEGRPFGIFVIRTLLPERTPELPTTRVVSLDDLRGPT